MVHCKHFCVKDMYRGDTKRMKRRTLILILLSTRKAATEFARTIPVRGICLMNVPRKLLRKY